MRVLFVTPYPAFPPHGGGLQRMYELMRALAPRHELWCLSLAPSPEAAAAAQPLAELCRLVLTPAPRRSLLRRAATTLLSPLPDMALRAPSATARSLLATLLAEQRFDLVQAESIETAQYALQALRAGTPAMLDQWNAEYLLQRRAALTDLRQPRRAHAALYSLIQWGKLARYERMLGARLPLMTVVSAEDGAALRRIGVNCPLPIVPNGVDCDYFAPLPATGRDPDRLVFTGTLNFRPNIDALRWFVEAVLPRIRTRRPNARLIVVGRSPAPAVLALAGPAVEIVGAVPDVRPYLASAGAFVLPMRMGGGVRLKLLEALATATPLVSTTMGADGVDGLLPGTHCLLADEPATFAEATLTLLEDAAQAQALATSGRAFVAARYAWSAIAPELEAVWSLAVQPH